MGVAVLQRQGLKRMFIHKALFSQTSIPLVEKSLDAATLRARAIAANLANLGVPGYRRIEVDFESQLREALDMRKLQGTVDQPGHIPLGRPDPESVMPRAYRSNDPTLPGEVNNVDVDMEAAKLAENQILFNFGVKFIQDRKGDIVSAIHGNPGQ